MTPAASLNAAAGLEIQRILHPGSTVYIAGGTGAVSPAVEQSIISLGYTVKRFFGATSQEVSLRIARDGIVNPKHVTIASQNDWKDSISAATSVAAADGAFILSNEGTLSAAAESWLDSLPDTVTITTVGSGARNAYPSTDGPVIGKTAVETNAIVAEKFLPNPPAVSLTTTNGYTDAVTGGALSATVGMPTLLNPATTLDPATKWSAVDHSSTTRNVTLFGGTGSLSATVGVAAQAAATEQFIAGEIVPTGEVSGTREQADRYAITPDWALEPTAFSTRDYTGMNDAEFDFCRWPSRWSICDHAFNAAQVAQQKANTEGENYWPGSAGNGGKRDAYRHCIWNGYMTMQMGTKTAKGFADRHEKGPKPSSMSEAVAQQHHRMDYHNNALGRLFGESGKALMNDPGLTFAQAFDNVRTWCMLSVNDGDLHTLKY